MKSSNHARNYPKVDSRKHDEFQNSVDTIPPVDYEHEALRITKSPYFRYKYLLERCLGVLLFIPALPVIAILYCLVRLTSKGPGIYEQERVGAGGTTFRLYKLRSMVVNAEKDSGPVWARPNDDRTTKLGRWLRRTHLDELPQLGNVVKGEMTLVGPRPERPVFVKKLSSKIHRYTLRHSVRPGITGLAQIYLPADENMESVRNKLAFDLEYLRTATFRLDLQIWICTALRLFGLRGGWGPRLVGLNRSVARIRNQIRASRQESIPLHVNLQRQERKLRRQKKRQRWAQVSPLSDSSLEKLLNSSGAIDPGDLPPIRFPR